MVTDAARSQADAEPAALDEGDETLLPAAVRERLLPTGGVIVLAGRRAADRFAAPLRSLLSAEVDPEPVGRVCPLPAWPDERTDSESADAADASADIAIVSLADADDHVDLLLGEACRRFPRHLLVEHRIGTHGEPGVATLTPSRFFAFGFQRLGGATPASDPRCRWYEFRLAHYKPAPDWLNAKFWANPERFHLHDE